VDNTLRLNFSNAKPDEIREGIKRLGKVFRESVEALKPKGKDAGQKVS
jgi:DNA-binding transcriptional MocR family regulator